jgi:hypothetical protein
VRPGAADWEEVVREEVRTCRAVVLVASPATRHSRFVRADTGIEEDMSIIALLLLGVPCLRLTLSAPPLLADA